MPPLMLEYRAVSQRKDLGSRELMENTREAMSDIERCYHAVLLFKVRNSEKRSVGLGLEPRFIGMVTFVIPDS